MGDTTRERLGDYELLQLIGDGAQGRVFKARRAGAPDDAGFFAVKVLRFSGDDEKKATRFQQSADTLQKLNHPAIVRYYGTYAWHAGEWDEAHCLVMEYLDGESLHDLIKRNPRGLPWLEVKRIFTACLEGLVYAREQGLIHRDIKPSNVFITRSGDIKLIDFDIARREDGSQTSTAGWKGTFDYMAPDFVQVANFRGDEQSDLFSLGVCLFQALTGRLPFPPLGEGAHIGYLTRWREAGATKPVVDGGLFRVLIHARALVTKCLQPAREQRMQTFQDMLTGLQAVEFRRLEHRGGDSYDLIDWLGRGTSGEAYLGRCVRDNLTVAVKRLSPPAHADRFVREAGQMQRSPHEAVVRYLDLIEVARPDQGREFFLVLECLEGLPGFSLRQRLQQGGALPPGEAIRLFIRYASALQHLHEADPPILHGNLKPANLYAPPGHPEAGRVLDLGVPRAAAAPDGSTGLAGPLDHLAPEFAVSGTDPTSPASDLYALGLCLFEALTGRPAFPALPTGSGKAWPAFEARARNPAPIESDAAVLARIPALVPILQQALQHDPEARYARAAHFKRDLEALLPDLPLENVAPTPSAPTADTFVRGDDAADAWTEDAQHTPEEAGTAATTGAPPAEPSPAAPPPPAKPRSGPRILLRAAIAVLVIGYGAWVARRFLPHTETNPVRATEETNARPVPRPPAFQLNDRFKSPTASAGYLTALAGEIARLRQGQTDGSLPGEDVKQAVETLERQAATLPALYRATLDAAVGARDLKAAEACVLDWSGIKAMAPVLGLSPEQHEESTRSMQAALASLQLDEALAGLRNGLPADPLVPEAWPRLEAAAQQWTALSARTWEGLAEAERTTRLTAAATLLRALIEKRLAAAPDVAALQTLQETAPHLLQQFAGSFEQRRTVLTQAEQGRAQFQKEVDAMLAAVPADAATPAELARAEEVAGILKDFPTRTWAGVDEAERLAAVSRVKEALLPTMAAVVASQRATTLSRVTPDSDLRTLLAPLQELEQRYPRAILLVAAAQKRAVADVEAAWKNRPAPTAPPTPAVIPLAPTASVAAVAVAAPPQTPAVKDLNEDIVLKALTGDGTTFVPQGATPLKKDDVNDLLGAAVPVRAGFNVMDLLISPKSGQDFLAAVDHLWKKASVFTGPFGDRLRDAAWQVIHVQLGKLAEATLKGTIGSRAPAQQARVRRSFIKILSHVDEITGRVSACPAADVLRARVTLYFEEGFLQDALLDEKVGGDDFLERQIPWIKERFDKVRATRGIKPPVP